MKFFHSSLAKLSLRPLLLRRSLTSSSRFFLVDHDWKNYPLKFKDFSSHDVISSIAPSLEIEHLSESKKKAEDVHKIKGILYGDNLNAFAGLVLDSGLKKFDAVFMIDPGSPQTYVSEDTMKKIGLKFESGPVKLWINGVLFSVMKARADFKEFNVIGADFLWRTKSEVKIVYKEKKVEIALGEKGE